MPRGIRFEMQKAHYATLELPQLAAERLRVRVMRGDGSLPAPPR